MNTSTSRTSPGSDADTDRLEAETSAPGGRTLNHAATVATSAVLGGAAAGALAGSVGGPIGAALGAAVGAVAAGFAGDQIADAVDTKAEEAYWRENYRQRPYVDPGVGFDDYGPAYGYGVQAAVQHPGRPFDDVEDDLSRDWGKARGTSTLEWDRARLASRDAWERTRSGGRE